MLNTAIALKSVKQNIKFTNLAMYLKQIWEGLLVKNEI